MDDRSGTNRFPPATEQARPILPLYLP